jgi:secondary thiamine-phosphate synthase enzyme
MRAMIVPMDRARSTADTVWDILTGAASHQVLGRIRVDTRGPGLIDLTDRVAELLARGGAGDGLATLFVRHTSCSLTLQENASPEVREDLIDALDRLAPRGGGWRHRVEGPDDMPAHIKTTLTGTSLAAPVLGGRLALGTWQAVYLIEHRDQGRRRELVVHFIGSKSPA